MGNNFNNKVEKLAKAKRRNRFIKNILLTMASVMVFVTVYVLILPAITAEQDDVAEIQNDIPVSEVLEQIDTSNDEIADGSENTEALDTNTESVVETESVDENTESVVETEGVEANAENSEETEGVEVNAENSEETEDAEVNVENTEETEGVEVNAENTEETENVDENTENSEETENAENPENAEASSGEIPIPEKEIDIEELLLGLRPLTEEEIILLTDEQIQMFESNRVIEAEIESPVLFASTRSNEKALPIVEGKISVELPFGLLGSNYYVKASLLPLDYDDNEKSRIFGYDIKVFNKNDNTELIIEEDKTPAIIKVYDTDLNSVDYSDNKYILNYYLNDSPSEYINPAIIDVIDSPIYTESGKQMGLASFNSRKFGKYAMFTSDKIEANPDPVTDKVKVAIESNMELSQEQIDERLAGISAKIEETSSVKNEYELECKIKDDEGNSQDTIEELTKVFAYNIYLVRNSAPYVINPEGVPVISLKVSIEHDDIKKADENFYRIYHVVDGEVLKENEMKILSVEDGVISFETTHFSDYALFKSNVDKNNYYTEDDDELDNIPLNEVITVEVFEQLIKKAADEAYKNNQTSVLVELGQIVEITDDYTLSNSLVNGLELTISRKDGLVHELFNVSNGAKLTVENITISGENRTVYAPLIVNEKGILEINSGANLINNTNLSESLYDKNETYAKYSATGGAIWSNGKVIMNGGLIQNCKAQLGGGIYIEGENGNTATLTMENGEIDSNYADYFETSWKKISNSRNPWAYGLTVNYKKYIAAGGGIYIGDYASAVVRNGQIHGNQSAREGGGISCRYSRRNITSGMPSGDTGYNTTFSMTGGSMYNNHAGLMAGAVFVGGNTDALILGGSFQSNTASGVEPLNGVRTFGGGAIYIDSDGRKSSGDDTYHGKLTMKNVSFTGNKSTGYIKGRGDVYAACEMSITNFGWVEGAVIYDNGDSSYKRPMDLYIYKKQDITISDKMLGGGNYNWTSYQNNPSDIPWIGKEANPSQEDIEKALPLVNVEFVGNEATEGGAVANNGELVIGYNPPDEYDEDTVSVSVQKEWVNDDIDNRPEKITVELLNGDRVVDTKELNVNNNWYYCWNNLDETGNWSVREVEVDGYKTSISEATENLRKKEKELRSGGKYIIVWKNKDRPLINNKVHKNWDLFFKSDYDYKDKNLNDDKIIWKAILTDNGTFKFKNLGTDKYMVCTEKDGSWPGGAFASERSTYKYNREFEYTYLDSVESGVLANVSYYSSDVVRNFIKMSEEYPLSYGGYYLPIVSNNNEKATQIDIYQVIDKSFTITNTKEDVDKVGLILHKVAVGENNELNGLSGAEFSLYQKAEDDDENAVEIVGVDIKGRLIKTVRSDQNGEANIDLLLKNTVYFLKENKAPSGHKGLGDKVIVFKIGNDGKFVDMSETAPYNTEEFIHVKVENGDKVIVYASITNGYHLYVKNEKIGYTLPETGGEGTGMYMALGLIMMIMSIGAIILKKYSKKGVS